MVSNGVFRGGQSIGTADDGLNGRGGSSAFRELRIKLGEIGTFRDIMCRQLETLQSYFDASSDVANNNSTSPVHCRNTPANSGEQQQDANMCNGFDDNRHKWADDCSGSSENQAPPHESGKYCSQQGLM